MKLLIIFSLITFLALIQLSSASDEDEAFTLKNLLGLDSASDKVSLGKRFPLFHFIATAVSGVTINDLLAYGHVDRDLWPQYNESISAAIYNTEEYIEFSKQMTEFIGAVEKLEEDKSNCELQLNALNNFTYVYRSPYANKWTSYDKHQYKIEQLEKSIDNYKSALNKIDKELPAVIESFIESLNETEKIEYKQLVEICEQYLASKDEKTKFEYFSDILDFIPQEGKVTGDLCAWNDVTMNTFVATVYVYGLI